MTVTAEKSGRFALGGLTVHRIGYGAMQLAGPHVIGRELEELDHIGGTGEPDVDL